MERLFMAPVTIIRHGSEHIGTAGLALGGMDSTTVGRRGGAGATVAAVAGVAGVGDHSGGASSLLFHFSGRLDTTITVMTGQAADFGRAGATPVRMFIGTRAPLMERGAAAKSFGSEMTTVVLTIRAPARSRPDSADGWRMCPAPRGIQPEVLSVTTDTGRSADETLAADPASMA